MFIIYVKRDKGQRDKKKTKKQRIYGLYDNNDNNNNNIIAMILYEIMKNNSKTVKA